MSAMNRDEACIELPGAAVVALSGGMDSTSLLLHLLARGTRVFGLSFDYGQRHRVEIERLQANIRLLTERGHPLSWQLIDLTDLGGLLDSALTKTEQPMPLGHYAEASMRVTVVPNRNAIFGAILYGHALTLAERRRERISIGLGVHAGDHAIYPDCRPEFYQRLWAAFQVGNWGSEQIELYLPYLNSDKYEILLDAHDSCRLLGLDFTTVFRNTWTSYLPDDGGRAHGLTGSDVERILAFHKLGVPDPIDYQAPWDQVVKAAQSLAQNQNKPMAEGS